MSDLFAQAFGQVEEDYRPDIVVEKDEDEVLESDSGLLVTVDQEAASLEEICVAIDTTNSAAEEMEKLTSYVEEREEVGTLTPVETEILAVATEAILKPFSGVISVKLVAVESGELVPYKATAGTSTSDEKKNSGSFRETVAKLFKGLIEFIKNFFKKVQDFLVSIFSHAAQLGRQAKAILKRNKKVVPDKGYNVRLDDLYVEKMPGFYKHYQKLYNRVTASDRDFKIHEVFTALHGLPNDLNHMVSQLEADSDRALKHLKELTETENINATELAMMSDNLVGSLTKYMEEADPKIANRIAGDGNYHQVLMKEAPMGGRAVFLVTHKIANGIGHIRVVSDTVNPITDDERTMPDFLSGMTIMGKKIGSKERLFFFPEVTMIDKLATAVLNGSQKMVTDHQYESKLRSVSSKIDRDLNDLVKSMDGKNLGLSTNKINLVRSSIMNIQSMWRYIALFIKECISSWYGVASGTIAVCQMSFRLAEMDRKGMLQEKPAGGR